MEWNEDFFSRFCLSWLENFLELVMDFWNLRHALKQALKIGFAWGLPKWRQHLYWRVNSIRQTPVECVARTLPNNKIRGFERRSFEHYVIETLLTILTLLPAHPLHLPPPHPSLKRHPTSSLARRHKRFKSPHLPPTSSLNSSATLPPLRVKGPKVWGSVHISRNVIFGDFNSSPLNVSSRNSFVLINRCSKSLNLHLHPPPPLRFDALRNINMWTIPKVIQEQDIEMLLQL